MYLCVHQEFALVRTSFSEKYDLIQKFRGVDAHASIRYNKPVDFMESGLMQKDKWDCWHIDVPFALNTDEATPVFVNGCFIGANHGEYSAVEIYAPNHNKTVKDIGSLWKDEAGISFTLMRVNDEDYLTFLSQNVGESVEDYSFVKTIRGALIYLENGENTGAIIPASQRIVDLRRSVRYKTKKVVGIKNGEEKTVSGVCECDVAEIREEYEIINPATVAETLRYARPEDGFLTEQDLGLYGEPMVSCSLIYRIVEDGTIFVCFDYKKLMAVNLSRIMGVMFQEKLDVCGGGIFRYLPKALPIETEEGEFNFSSPLPICNSAFPLSFSMTREFWEDYGSPCERVVDYFRDEQGNDKLAFACGFLPIFDGKPSIRDKHVSNVVQLKYTRKHYPTFAEGVIENVKGVAYKKYFIPMQDKASFYIVPFNGKKYIYVDIFAQNTITFPLVGRIELLEKSNGVEYLIENDTVTVSGEKGFAVFVQRNNEC